MVTHGGFHHFGRQFTAGHDCLPRSERISVNWHMIFIKIPVLQEEFVCMFVFNGKIFNGKKSNDSLQADTELWLPLSNATFCSGLRRKLNGE